MAGEATEVNEQVPTGGEPEQYSEEPQQLELQPEEGATSEGEAQESPTPEPEAAAEESTPEGDEFLYEFDPGDGSGVQQLTASEMAQKLANYRKLESTVGRQANELAEYRKKGGDQPAPQPQQVQQQAQPQQQSAVNMEDLNNLDWEDPDVVREMMGKVLTQNQALQRKLDNIDETIDAKASERETQRELMSVASNNKNLSHMQDIEARKTACQLAAQWAITRNQQAGTTVYPDLESAVNGYYALLRGEKEPGTSEKALIRRLRQPGTPAAPTGGKPSGDVVQRYKALKTNQERAEFLSKLSDEEEAYVTQQIYAEG